MDEIDFLEEELDLDDEMEMDDEMVEPTETRVEILEVVNASLDNSEGMSMNEQIDALIVDLEAAKEPAALGGLGEGAGLGDLEPIEDDGEF